MQRVDDLTSPPVVGQRYLVFCAFVPTGWDGGRPRGWWPLMGPPHTDPEIGFPWEHIHIDHRFLDAEQLRWNSCVNDFSRPLTIDGYEPLQYEWRARVCHREMSVYPSRHDVRWQSDLEARYAGTCLKPCRICPHRGIPIGSVPVRDGQQVCPGHGLAFDEAGHLVRRA